MPDALVCQFIGNCDAVTDFQFAGNYDAAAACQTDKHHHATQMVSTDTQSHRDTLLLRDIITLSLIAQSHHTIAAKQFLEYLTAKHSFDYQRSVLLKTTALLPSAKAWLQQIYG